MAHVIVLGAGIGGKPAPLHEVTTEQWDLIIRLDLTSVFWSQKYDCLSSSTSTRCIST